MGIYEGPWDVLLVIEDTSNRKYRHSTTLVSDGVTLLSGDGLTLSAGAASHQA